jgi:gelsolin
VWRIKQFKLTQVPANQVGTFYDGDSYIVLHTIKANNDFSWTIYFWLGENTSQDEAGTAAYKTVELDDHLGGKPIEHREVQGHESESFLNLFSAKGGIRLLKGGFEAGFHHVTAEKYQPRLLHVHGTTAKNVRVLEVDLAAKSLNSSDVFVLDAGLHIYQFNGSKAKPIERNKGSTIANAIRDERESGCQVHVLDEGGNDLAPFWKFFGGEQKIAVDAPALDAQPELPKVLFRLSDASGKMTFTKVAEGNTIKKSNLDSNDVFVLDAGYEIFVWVGQKTSAQERKTALQYAVDYLKNHNRNTALPISRILEGGENEVFNTNFS